MTLRPDTGDTARPGTPTVAPGVESTVLAAGRDFLANSLIDVCVIERVVAVDSNPLTAVTTKQRATVYSGPCLVEQAAATWAGPTEVGEANLRTAGLQLKLPVAGTEGLLIDDRVTVTSCRHDTELVGRIFTITGLDHASQKTMRRLGMMEVLA